MHWNIVATALLLLTGLDISFAVGDSRQAFVPLPAVQNQAAFFPQFQQQQQQIIFNPNSILPTPTPAASRPNPLLQLFQMLAFLRLAGVETSAFDGLFGGIFGSSKFDFEEEGWYEASNNCWYEYFTNPKNYQDAAASCKKKGGARLASRGISDDDVRNELVENAFVFPNGWEDPWIGLDDLEEENTFVWSDDTTIATGDNLWPGVGGGPTGNGDCVTLDNGNLITDQSCGAQEHYVCEYCPTN